MVVGLVHNWTFLSMLEHAASECLVSSHSSNFLAEDIKATQIIQYSGFANFLFAKNLK